MPEFTAYPTMIWKNKIKDKAGSLVTDIRKNWQLEE